ncbi:CBS domain-containing protein [Lysinibacillus sp. G4S2]|uniref:CBS domain-containing protein n=1 Tax=Lysinibacillus sp. G4S2 TaxID=3055859 RepID=UPI0025A1FB01|nr:CBS domain-containing protein [Lysinibacillus sp. G4S2]MDM5245919.1 CBS domain-containing protein [Lysinibacillus sp. G4S2]
MDIENSNRFLTAFNRIDQRLRDIIGAKDFMPFYRLIDQAKKKDVLVRKYEDDLRSYADLRNAIVHHRTSLEYVIAEPHLDVVERIEYIEATLAKPILVGQMFRKKVLVFQESDSLKHVLKVIRHRKYTQFPVYHKDQFKGLVTTVGITNWLATVMVGNQIPEQIPTLYDILLHEKNRVNYKFVSRYITIYEAEDIFKQGVERGSRFEALLITEHGKPHQKLIGIVTPLDIVKID